MDALGPNPVDLFMKQMGTSGPKGSEKPKQVKPNQPSEENEFAGLIKEAVDKLQEAKNKVAQTSIPATKIANVLRELTILLNTEQGKTPGKGKDTETAKPGEAPIDMEKLLTRRSGSLVSNPSTGEPGLPTSEG